MATKRKKKSACRVAWLPSSRGSGWDAVAYNGGGSSFAMRSFSRKPSAKARRAIASQLCRKGR